MKSITKAWKVSCLACGAIAFISAGAAPSLAQTANPFPQTGPTGVSGESDINDIFSGSGQSSSSIFSLINRIQLMNGRSYSDFKAEQNEGFQSAVDEFRQKQQQKIQGSPSAAGQPLIVPAP